MESPSSHELIPLEPERPRPALPGWVAVGDSLDATIDAVVADMLVQARNCVRVFGDFHVALSGGTTPEPVYRRLMYDPACRDFPWRRTHLWQVDERRVPMEHARRNYRMIRDTLVLHSDIPPSQAHPMPVDGESPDREYEQELRSVLEWRERGHDRLDYVLLGMGSDWHTAGLFPGSPAVEEEGRLVTLADGPDGEARVTMTLELLNAARLVGVMVTGEGKRGAISGLIARRPTVREAPILGVKPAAGELRWYLDRGACPQ